MFNSRVKALNSSVMSHGADVRVLASASSDGEVKMWTMADNGSVTENGMYDSGNRLLCLTIHDAAIEQLDSFSVSLKENHDLELSSEEDSEEEYEDEWNGLEDA